MVRYFIINFRLRAESRSRSIGMKQQFGSGYPVLEPLGVDFKKDCPERLTPSPMPALDVLRRVSRSRTSVASGKASLSGSFEKKTSPLAETKPDLKLPTITAAVLPPPAEEKEHSDDEDIEIQLPKLGVSSEDNGQIPLLPTLSKRMSPKKQRSNSPSIRSTAISISSNPAMSDDEDTWDPYLLLEIVNPDLLTRPTNDQLNTRKWILGALAASCLAGNPLKDFLSSFSYTHKVKIKKVKEESSDDEGSEEDKGEEDGEEEVEGDNLTDQAEVALNNLDCWQRIERIRSTSGTSHAGRRAEEITNAGGWGGLEAPPLLPNFHYYLASLSGDLLESHLEPYIEMKFISKHYLSSPEKLGIDFEVMIILREMLKSQFVNDSWFALLQEHNFTVLKEHVLKFFLWDDKRMLVNCAPSKQICKHRVVTTSMSDNLVANDAFSEEMERDLTNQFIFAPKSDQVDNISIERPTFFISLDSQLTMRFIIIVSRRRCSKIYFTKTCYLKRLCSFAFASS